MPDPSRPLLLGHRGARAVRSIPENTFESFDRALADGCDGFEFDVRLTADSIGVVCHDPSFQRVEIARSAAAEVSQLPRLADVLSRYQHSAFLDIELKEAGLENITLDLLQKYPPRRGFVISSFLPQVLVTVAEMQEHIPLGLICETRVQLRCWKDLPVDCVIPHYKLLTAALADEVRVAGKKILVWTVNDSRTMERVRDLGVDGIISDQTEVLCRTVAR